MRAYADTALSCIHSVTKKGFTKWLQKQWNAKYNSRAGLGAVQPDTLHR